MTGAPRVTRALTAAAKGSVVTGTLAGLVLASPLGAAAAADGPAIVVNRETVQAELKSSGALDTARLFSQLVINGDGKATILDPTSGKNIRDLDGFSAPDVNDGMAKYVVDVRGRTTRRTVSDFTGKLPLTVQVEYFLDGQKKKASDLVGKSGVLDVKYTIENVSATPTPISYTVAGKKTTKTIDLVTPLVGQLSINLPSSFTDIDTPRADVAGDGRGGQLLNWTMVLFEPIGKVKQEFGYTARVKDLQLPAAKIQAVPVSPNRHPELAFGEKGFSDGAASGGNVAFAGQTIDTNLAKLRDGAGALLDGLTQLAAGAAALKDGLAGQAAPGAVKLADGLGQANDGGSKLYVGLNKLSDGAGQLRDGLSTAKAGSSKLAAGADQLGDGLTAVKEGSAKLAAGLGAASAGSEKLLDGSQDLATGAGLTAAGAKSLSAGLAQISAGLDQLAATTGLPAVKSGLQQLRLGIDHPIGAAGPSDPGGLIQGLQQISGGLAQLNAPTGLPAAKGGVDAIKAGIAAAIVAGGDLDKLQGAALALLPVVQVVEPTCATPLPAPVAAPATPCQLLSALYYGIGQVKTNSVAANAGLGQVSAGLASAISGVSQLQTGVGAALLGVQTSLLGGVDQLIAGVTTAVTGVLALQTGAKTAAAGAVALADGTAKVAAGAGLLSETGAAPLADGLSQLLTGSLALDAGLGKLADGGGQAVDGVHAIDDGLTKLSAGSVALAAGAEQAAAGSGDLSSGLQQLYAGGQQLADGLGAAADGSGQLADGLEKAKAGNVQIRDGAEALRTQAAVPLATAGQATANEYAERFAIMTALDEKAADGALPYGAPEGATGTAAYDFVLAGATSSSQDNTTRGVAAIALLALASASGLFVRRRVLSQ